MSQPGEAEVKAWERTVAIKKWTLRIMLVILAACLVPFLVIQSGKEKSQSVNSGRPLSETDQSPSSGKEERVLREQKLASENVTRSAVELRKDNRMPEVRKLYKDRWDQLATLRTNITFDSELTTAEKGNIDQALRSEQEGITEILAKYERLYGP